MNGEPIIKEKRMSTIQFAFRCKCGKAKGAIAEDEVIKPCPKCGRQYIGVYNNKTFQVEAVEYSEIEKGKKVDKK